MRSEAYISLGANLGDRKFNIIHGLKMINNMIGGLSVSSIYETTPQGFSVQPVFYNAVCRLWTDLSPFELLHKLKEIENALRRTRVFIDGPRTLDLDILMYDQLVLHSMVLTIPHPKMTLRSFVMLPLAELSPSLIHPVMKKSVALLAKRFASLDYPICKSRVTFTL